MRVIEVAGLGPGPFAAMMLSDMGADVLRVDRPDEAQTVDYNSAEEYNLVNRGRSSVRVDLKSPAGRALFLEAVARADVLLEGYRPGVMERLGVGPRECAAVNPRLVFVRITGWGQHGPLARTAGHDANYVALSGLLGLLGPRAGRPAIPLNLLGDYASGAFMAVIGALGALVERARSGRGQVVDTAIVDGAALLTTFVHGQRLAGRWGERGTNFLDGGAPYYDIYDTADGGRVAFGAIEDGFFAEFLALSGADPAHFAERRDPARWPAMRERLAEVFRTRTRDEWRDLFAHTDGCVTPILEVHEVFDEPHLSARGVLAESFGLRQPQPAPRFSRTPSEVRGLPCLPGDGGAELLKRWGIGA
ncbi:carnitine dehydratase [Plantactinospora sp. KBS50]|nr:carnitine dehydratase [Plantactinospora sp. KBS50]